MRSQPGPRLTGRKRERGDIFVARADLPHATNPDRPLHAVMVGTAVRHAQQFVHADGIDLSAPSIVTPVGVTCRQCPRDDCAARAFERAAV
jgi:predicted transcriptional regulator